MKKIRNILLIILIVLLLFTRLYNYELPYDHEDTDNLNGYHIWLSASTIKFTNIWLSEGLKNTHMLMLEEFDSVEEMSFQSRTPYISYPTGTVIISYVYAKLLGKASIGIYDVRKLSVILYGLDSVMIALIFYLIAEYMLKLKSGASKVIMPVAFALFWIILPPNVYYLGNIYFSDMAVLPFAFMFIALEIVRRYASSDKKALKYALNVLCILVTIGGCLTDYYFWLLIFTAGVYRFIEDILQKKKLIPALGTLAFYGLPALGCAAAFIAHISIVDNWFKLLTDKAAMRMNMTSASVNYAQIADHLKKAYQTLGPALPFIAFAVPLVLFAVLFLRRRRKAEEDKNLSAFTYAAALIEIPAMLHMILLTNHWEHEFSILKLGLPIVFAVFSLCYIAFYVFKLKPDCCWQLSFINGDKSRPAYVSCLPAAAVAACLASVFLLNTGNVIPGYYKARYETNEMYYMENMISENTDYYDVIFSNTEEITVNPPQYLVTAGKLVYKIKSFDDIDRLFPELPKEARICFIVSNDYSNKGNDESVMDLAVFDNCEFVAIDITNTYALYRTDERFWEE